MSKFKGRMALMVVGVIAALALLVVPAMATHIKKIDSQIKITKTSPKFKGKVSSSNHACKVHRKVKLYAVEPGNEVVGTAKTDNHGRWKIAFQGENAGQVHYYAKVLRRAEGTAGTIYVCKHARSAKVVQAN